MTAVIIQMTLMTFWLFLWNNIGNYYIISLMREFQQRKRLKRRIYSIPALILLLIFLGLVIDGTWKVFQKERESRANLTRVQSQLATLQERNGTLSADVARLKTEQGTEEEIRSKYEVSKPGEEVLVIVDKDAAATTSPPQNVFQRWWSGFLDLFKRN